MTETQIIPSQSQYNISQFQIPPTTSNMINQTQTQPQTFIPSPGIEATYSAPEPVPETQQTTYITSQVQNPQTPNILTSSQKQTQIQLLSCPVPAYPL